MAHKKAPLSGRDLIRYLPDLLTGKEPVFDDPAVQRFITQDPEGRAAVGLIADTAAALTVAHDRVATQTYAAIKPPARERARGEEVREAAVGGLVVL
jgi:hypothetical protein